jgi:hypothetical protein
LILDICQEIGYNDVEVLIIALNERRVSPIDSKNFYQPTWVLGMNILKSICKSTQGWRPGGVKTTKER